MSGPDELTLTVARCLEIDYQYVELVEAWEVERIALVRSAGRRAGRLLGLKIVTLQSAPGDGDDGRVRVTVAVREFPNRDEAQRMGDRAKLLIEKALEDGR